MDVLALREKLVSDYRHYIKSFVRIDDERIDSFVKEQFETGAFWPDAILQLNPAYEPGPTLDELAAQGDILESTADFFRGQGGKPLRLYLHVVLIAIPIRTQVYFNSTLTYGLMRLLRVQHSVAAPGALIGASNFFELAVATAIALFGPGSGAALATVVGVLVRGAGHIVRMQCLQSHSTLVSGHGGCGSSGANWVDGGFCALL